MARKKTNTEEGEGMSDTEAATSTNGEEPRRRGRPRPDEVVARDNQILELIEGEMTTQEIAEKVGTERNAAYLSLYRLRREGKVQRVQNETTGAAMRHWVRV